MNLIYKNNFYAFFWHAVLLSLASSFMNVDTIIPAVLLKAGSTTFQLGILTALTIGLAKLSQLSFAFFLSNKKAKKNHLLLGINIRVLTLFLISAIIFFSIHIKNNLLVIILIFLFSIFAFSGSYANISYTDILGKGIQKKKRKKFLSLRQAVSSIGILISALTIKFIIMPKLDYPINYTLLFFIAAILLLLASLGFWLIKEPITQVDFHISPMTYIKRIPSYILKDRNLLYYLILINVMIIGLIMIPFVINRIKEYFVLSGKLVSTLLLDRTGGMLLTGLLINRLSMGSEYKVILIMTIITGSSIPLISYFFINNLVMINILFFIVGVFWAGYSISSAGILLEISNSRNRAIYTGISGFGSIAGAVVPVLAGFLIEKFTYSIVFIPVSIFMFVAGLISATRINCIKPIDK